MTKKYINDKVKNAWNTTLWIGHIKIAIVGWREYRYMIIEPEETFEDASKDNFLPVQSCFYKKDFVDMLHKYTKHIKN